MIWASEFCFGLLYAFADGSLIGTSERSSGLLYPPQCSNPLFFLTLARFQINTIFRVIRIGVKCKMELGTDASSSRFARHSYNIALACALQFDIISYI